MSKQRNTGLIRRPRGLMALEPRFMFDGAAVDTAVEAGKSVENPLLHFAAADAALPAAVLSARAEAQRLVIDFLSQTDAKDKVFVLFNGGSSSPSAQWAAAFDQLTGNLLSGGDAVRVELRSSAEMQGAKGAFSNTGTTGQLTIYLNADWLVGNAAAGIGAADSASVTAVLIEELGHSLDARLNANVDTPGDEGEHFSRVLLDGLDPAALDPGSMQNDVGTLVIDGQSLSVEFASFTFTNAYEMVYDQDNNTNTYGVSTSAIGVSERWADKEQNLHYFNSSVSLGRVDISDGSNGVNFSGNDISAATSITVGGNTYYGWVSRPIKANGIVRGFYFWTDSSFTTLSLAQQDGNQDGDSSVLDNRGFVLVVDQAWFDAQILATKVSESINNAKDGNKGTIWVANVGSSSDRVDSALNALVSSNVAPVLANDTASGTPSGTLSSGQGNAALEQGYNTNTSSVITASVAGSGNVLANDTDSNGDTLSVTTVSSKLTGAVTTATSAGVSLVGKYGTLSIKSDGSWTYTPDDTNPTVNALLSGNLQEQFTYTASDGKGGTATATLTVQINGSNDAPVAANDYNSAKESLTDGAGTTTYSGYTATGSVLPNDSDVDSADTKTISGATTSGSATGSTQASSNQSSTVLSFAAVSSSIKVGHYVFWDGDQIDNDSKGTSGGGGTANNTVNLTTSASVNITVQSIDLVNKTVTLSGVVSNKTLSSGTVLGFSNSSSGSGNYKDSTISGATSQSTSKINLSTYSGTIAIGMTVTGGALPAGTKVVDVGFDTNGNPTSVTISSTTAVTSAALTFSGNISAGQTLAGKYGTLDLAADGTYTYTPYADNPAIDNGDAVLETFTYTMLDAAGASSTANLYITVYGASTTDPVLTADTATAYESGVGRSSTSPYSLTGNNTAFAGVNVSVAASGVLSNDTSITGYTVNSYTKADGSGTTLAGSNLVGVYGTLNISSTGAYTYNVDNTNATVNALLPGSTLTEVFRYKLTNSSSLFAWSTLTITIQGTNDAPVAVADTGSALTEDVVLSASGNVLGNDTDVDSGDTKTVSKAGTSSANTAVTTGTTSANGLAVGGTYGTLTIGADGTYSYVLATASDATRYAALQALTSGQQVTETFSYEVKDSNGATSTTTLAFAVNGTNEPPVNSYPNSVTGAIDTPISWTAGNLISVSDADGNLSSVTVHVDYGTLTSSTSVSGFTVGGAGTGSLVITGTQTQINAYLANLTYTPNTGFSGTDYLTIFSQDSSNAYDSDGVPISIPTVFAGPTVLESDLSSGSNPSGTGESAAVTLTAPTGQNFGTSAQSGTDTYGTWTLSTGGVFTYTLTSAPAVSGTGTTRSINVTTYDQVGNATTNTVTVTVTDDAPAAQADTKVVSEGASTSGNVLTDGTPDKFGADGAKVTSPVGGVVGVAAGSNTATAVTTGADGTTHINGTYGYLTMNSNGSYTYYATASITSTVTDVFVYTIEDKDGDRSTTTLTVTVNDSSAPTLAVTGYGPVNEGSTYAMFTVTPGNSTGTDLIDLSITNGSATLSAPAASAPYIQFSTDGTNWTTYDGASSKPVGGAVFYVRVNITSESDTVYEGSETFSLVACYTALTSISDSASTTIVDDGTGTRYTGSFTSGSPVGNTTSLDDDRPSFAINDVTVNEAQGTMTFTVTKTGSTNLASSVDYAFADGSATGGGTDYTGTAGTLNFAAGEASKTITVTVNNDSVFEGAETFNVNLSNVSGATIGDSQGVGTIKDDGTGNSSSGGTGTASNDDRALAVNSITVNEGDGTNYAVFTVTANAGQTLTLALGNGASHSATSGVDYTNALEYWSGSAWVPYTAAFAVPGTAYAQVSLLVRVAITGDSVYEGAEDFNLTAAYTSGASRSATGVATIMDDGTGTKYTSGDPTGSTPATDATHLDDDRSLSVTGGSYNEASPRAVFTVNATNGLALTLDVQNAAQPGKAPTGNNEGKPNDSLDNAPIYYSLDGGATWQLYTGPITAGAVPVLVAVDITNERDDVYEGEEQLKLVVTSGSQSASGYASIFDDGTGTITKEITAQTTHDTGANDASVPKDDDRPITVTGGSYNEASPRALFTVNATAGQVLSLDVQNAAQPGKAPTGNNEGKPNDSLDNAPIYYSLDGGATWQLYTGPITAGAVPVLVAVDITNERDDVYEGEEQLRLVVTSGSQSASGYASIFDDGTGVVTQAIDGRTVNDAGGNDPTATKDDDRPKPAPPVVVTPAPVAPPAAPAVVTQPPPAPAPASAFASALQPLAPKAVVAEPVLMLADVKTSSSGYPIPVNESAPPGLTLNRGVTDQFIQTADLATKVSLPFDAFIHSNKDAVIKLEAKQADNTPLPKWVQFDPSTGVFEVTPPKGFKGKLDLMVKARDDDGREATAMFRMFVGEQAVNQPQSRSSFSEKLRMAGKRPVMLVRVAEAGPHRQGTADVRTARVRTG